MNTASILIICTANICRSPVAQAALTTSLENSGISVESVGTHATSGWHADPEAVAYVRRRLGIDLIHRARRLTRSSAAGADLILTMTAEQRAWAVADEPRIVRRTFTLRELGQIVHGLSPAERFDELRHFSHRCARLRSRMQDTPGDLDIADPYGGPPAAYAASFEQIREASDAIARAITGSVGRDPESLGRHHRAADASEGGAP